MQMFFRSKIYPKKSQVLVLRPLAENIWEEYFIKIERSNLIHSWAYGKAKCDIEGWDVTGYVLMDGELPLALLQVRKKTYGWVVKLVRINRGPLWFNVQLQNQYEHEFYRLLRLTYAKRKGYILLLSPESFNYHITKTALTANRFVQYKRKQIGTIWLDLSKSDAELKKSLRSNWRGQLRGCEKSGLDLVELPITEYLEWFITQYQLFRSHKDFSGLNMQLLSKLIDIIQNNPNYNASIFCVRLTGDALAATLMIRHGAAATYLLVWNNSYGRRMNASNLLLWSAVLLLKQQGCKWLDLGGISECNPVGKAITHFKRGLGGEEMWFAGDFIAL